MMQNYTEQYLLYGADLNDCTTKEEVKRHNRAMKKLGKIFHQLQSEEDKTFLLDLLQCEDDQIRSLVAAHCLGLNVYLPEAKKVLHSITKGKNPILAFEAQATLDVWKKQGYLNF